MNIARKGLKVFVFAAVAFAGGNVWSATPVAVWEGDFNTATKTGTDNQTYTLTVKDDGGILISWPTGRGAASVVACVSGLAVDSAKNQFLASVGGDGENRTGVTLGTDGQASGIWSNNVWNNTTQTRTTIDPPASGDMLLAFCHAYDGGTYAYVKTGDSWTCVYGASGLGSPAYDSTRFKAVAVGSSAKADVSAYVSAANIAISKVAVFSSQLSGTEVESFLWPSEVSSYTANSVSGTINWSDITFDNTWQNGADKAAVINLSGSAVITLPAGFEANKLTFSGAYDVKLVAASNIAVESIALENGATLSERPVTTFEATSTISVPANATYVTYGDITANAAVAAEGTLKIATGTATIGGTAQDLKGTLTVERGATFKTTASDWPAYGSGSTVNVFGTLDLNNRRWTVKNINPINLYTGGRIIMAEGGSTDGGCSINAFDAGTDYFELTVVKADGFDTAECAATIGPQAHAKVNVPAAAKLVLSAPVSSSVSGRLGPIEKIGAGALEVSGDIHTLESLNVTDGTVSFVDGAVAPRAITGDYAIASGTLEVPATSVGGATVKAGATLVIPVDNATLTAGTTVTVAAVETDGQVQFKDPSGALIAGTVSGNAVTLAPIVYTFTGTGAWSDAANWEGERKPGNGNTAVITGAVTIDEVVSVAGLTGTGSITIPADATLTSTGAVVPTVSGAGTLVVSGVTGTVLPTVAGLTANAWTGTLWLKGMTGKTGMNFANLGNAGSTIKISGVSGWMANAQTVTATVELANEDYAYGLNIHDGSSGDQYVSTFNKLAGNGKLLADGGSTAGFLIKDWSSFTGSVTASNKTITFGTEKKSGLNKIVINEGAEVTIAEGATWTANGGIQVDGTLVVAGTTTYNNFTPQTATHGTVGSQVRGAGEVVYLGALPADAATAMYTNEVAWTGTVTLKNFGELDSRTGISNTGHVRATLPGKTDVESWQNVNSRIKFKGVKAWTPNNVVYDINLVLEDQVGANDETIYAWHNDSGGSGNTTTFAKLSGSGTFYDNAACQHILKFTDASDFTGAITIQGKRVCLGTSTTTPAVGGIQVSSAIAAAGQNWTAPGGVTLEDGSSIVYRGGTLTTSVNPTLAGTVTVGLGTDVTIPEAGAKVLAWTTKPTGVTFTKAKSLPEKSRLVAKGDGLYLSTIMPFIIHIQ